MPIVPKEVTDQSDTQFQWLHFGGGNLYRAFHAEVTQTLIDQQALTKGIVVCETFDEQVIDQVYAPYENDILEVIMHEGGRLEKKLLQSTAASYYCHPSHAASYEQIRKVFREPSLQLVTVTITEKGYGLKDSQGNFFTCRPSGSRCGSSSGQPYNEHFG